MSKTKQAIEQVMDEGAEDNNVIWTVENPPKDSEGLNVVTNAEVQAFEGVVVRMANSFAWKNSNGAYSGENKKSVASINRSGWTVDDLKQELRIAVWIALRHYDKSKALTAFGLCQKHNFVIACMKNRIGMLANDMWAMKRGNNVLHLDGDFAANLLDAYNVKDEGE